MSVSLPSKDCLALSASPQSEQQSIIARMAALLVCVFLFGAAWSQDQPDPRLLAQRELILPNIGGASPPAILAVTRTRAANEQQLEPVARALTTAPLTAAVATESATISQPLLKPDAHVELIAISQSMTVVRDDLHGSLETLMQHVSQLPMGLPTGQYRIVDSHGGTGWLKVRQNAAFPTAPLPGGMISTATAEDTMRFIQISQIANALSIAPVQ